ncbi:rho guanine nucleotide exchange factor 1 isoform X1 [Malaclemys terrapin pileata]|uniref:rho guanine nucleotide exchange factor 1 isoform X1 n=1 Tax=Malaclemys terrapin pileata TaxID=2991368 RepID=UPI0023A79175|nr:rho guanine nucleotide exchange factor 1 isoform X1 [Malaclemys terrapin pileata]XP_053866536.1 rho guanine nucleotide exchange factor 1 isoform X1 [Malaclemys terrapin pileata]XP_053866537.1 rho guanine nucleotide exchange factor 1 isoform X1 [Malaclemys terrapin pileata]
MDLDEPYNGGPAPGAHSGSSVAIIGAEDEDFENDIEPTPEDHSSVFQSMVVVKSHPAYLMAFLQHVVLQFDSCPVLCYLHVELIRKASPKEGKKLFLDFYHMFLDKAGLLRVHIPAQVQFELDRSRPELLPDETLRQFLNDIQNCQEPEISRQLEDFRSKRLMGMTPGEQELAELESYHTRDRGIREAKEKQLAELLLARLDEMHPTISTDEEKSSAIFAAIVTYMKYLGVKTKLCESKKSKGNFFRKKMSGSRKPEEPPKPRKGFSLLDATRWNRGESHNSDFRQSKVPEGEAEKAVASERKGLKLLERSESRGKGAVSGTPGLEPPGVSVTVNPPPGEGTDGELGSEPQCPVEQGEAPPSEQPPEDSAENESPEPGGAGGGEPPQSFLLPQSEETEPRVSELEPEPPTWRQRVPPDTLLRLKKGEVKRQEVINELFLTEHAHVRMLRVLLEVFYQPLLSEGFFQETELANIFPGLDELMDVHTTFLESLKKLREKSDCIIAEIGDTLLARFDGTEGGWFQKISARFCSRQSFALEQLKAKQRKETRFSQFIQEAESQPRCRRLQLKDIIPIEMQRLTKYPLLLENIAKYTEEEEERAKVQRAAECCRQILNHVNQEVRHMENFMKLKDYQKRLDLSSLKQSTDPLLSEFKNTDISKRNLVHEGGLTWRVSKDKAVDVHVLLLDDILVLLQRQEERLVLRCHSRPPGPTPEPRQVLSPIIKLSSAMTREVATDRNAFYVIFSWENGAQIYELVAQTVSERKNWCALISETAGSLKLPGSNRQKPRRAAPSLSAPYSPSYYREPLLSTSENGNSSKERLHSDEREKDGALEGMEFEERSLEKPEKDSERILAELLALHKPQAVGCEGGLAAAALERVSALKRLLVGGSPLPEDRDLGSPEDGWRRAPENRGAGDEDEERDAGDGAESEGGAPGGAPNGPGSPGLGSRCPDGEGPGSSIVLTPRQAGDVRVSCQHLEEAVLRLKDMEDDYSQLQQLLAKYSSPPSPSFT